MTKKDIILAVHHDIPHVSQRFIHEAVNLFFAELGECLMQGGSIELRGFGIFGCKKRAEYVGMNPKTQQKIQIPSKKNIFFKPSNILKQELIHKKTEKKGFLLKFIKI